MPKPKSPADLLKTTVPNVESGEPEQLPLVRVSKQNYFPKVKEAREALRAKALELFELHLKIIKDALAAENYEVAAQANQWLMEHMPAEEGEKMIDISIDKPKEGPKLVGPSIQIGFKLGGVDTQSLPAAVIDVEPEDKN